MLGKLQAILDRWSNNPERVADSSSIRVISAALMLEVARADHFVDPVELTTILKILEAEYRLEKEEVNVLMDLAQFQADAASSLYELARHADKGLDYLAKLRLLRCLWRVAFADKVKDKYEEYIIRKVADLLHIAHRDFIQARLEVEAETH